jgi:hypothetical protein
MKKLQATPYKFRLLFSAFWLLSSIFYLLPSVLFAQTRTSFEDENKKFFFGINFGPTIDWFAPTTNEFDLVRNKEKAGIIAGLNFDIAVTKDRFLYVSTGLLFRYLQGELSFVHLYDFTVLSSDNKEFLTTRTFQTMYLTLPTGVKFRTNPSRGCVFAGKLGLYHNFKIGENQFDNFSPPAEGSTEKPPYHITTTAIKNKKDASFFAESGYIGLGFEYVLSEKARVFIDADYSCQFNYFSKRAKNNITDAQFKSVVHSLHIIVGVMF